MKPAGIRRLAENWPDAALSCAKLKGFVPDKDNHVQAILRAV
jgi:hypothetical protein